MRNLGYSLLATALSTEAGAQPPGFTAHTRWLLIVRMSLHCQQLKPSNSKWIKRTIGDVGDFTEDVVPADLFVSLWWADQGLTDHGDVDFGTDTPAGRLRDHRTEN